MDDSSRALFEHFRSTPPPETFGCAHQLPPGLEFLFVTALDTDRIMIVRECYNRIFSIIHKHLLVYNSGGGILHFSSGQGNGKTWLSLYIVWVLVHQRRTVVCENRQLGLVHVIRADGRMYLRSCPANAAGQGGVPELAAEGTIHVFDAKAGFGVQPVESPATASRNCYIIAMYSTLARKK